VTPKSGVLLLMSCITAIAAVGCVFELSSGEPDLGQLKTSLILAASIPLTGLLFWWAVLDTRASNK
jgi:hypothetical protein